MALHRDRFSAPSQNQQAAPWALLWLGAMAGCAWVPLLLADRLTTTARISSQLEPSLDRTTPTHLKPAKSPLSTKPTPWKAAKSQPGNFPQIQPPFSTNANREAGHTAALPIGQPDTLAGPVEGKDKPSARAPISGSLLLGGPLGLDSLQEKPMVPAARLEETLRARSENRLEAVPQHWRPTMRALLNGSEHVLPAKVVRLPAPHLTTPEEYPMVLKPDGMLETSTAPSAVSRASLERWAQHQKGDDQGRDRPVLVVLEPMTPDSQPTNLPEEKKQAAP